MRKPPGTLNSDDSGFSSALGFGVVNTPPNTNYMRLFRMSYILTLLSIQLISTPRHTQFLLPPHSTSPRLTKSTCFQPPNSINSKGLLVHERPLILAAVHLAGFPGITISETASWTLSIDIWGSQKRLAKSFVKGVYFTKVLGTALDTYGCGRERHHVSSLSSTREWSFFLLLSSPGGMSTPLQH